MNLNELNIFWERINNIYSPEEVSTIKKGFSQPREIISIRVNTIKSSNQEVEQILQENNIDYQKIDFLENAYILKNTEIGDIWKLNIYKTGQIYLQSLSSQLPVSLVDVADFDTVLDITAAPGGKTSQISAKLNNTGKVIANDNNQIRIDKLQHTLKKQGCSNVEVIKSDARNIGENHPEYLGYFNHIIADLPCSAEGKFDEKNEKSFGYWNMGVVKRNFKLQKQIMKSVIPLLKNNGTLVYSTCTLAPEENEEIVHMLLSCFPELELETIDIQGDIFKSGLTGFGEKFYRKTLSKTLRVLPSKITEGFYIAKFKKIEN